MTPFDLELAHLKRLCETPAGKEAVVKAAATLGIKGGRKWGEFTDAEIDGIYWATLPEPVAPPAVDLEAFDANVKRLFPEPEDALA